MKRTSLRRTSAEKSAKRKKDRELKRDLMTFFSKIWGQRPHRCEACGNPLGQESRTYHFDHLVEKSKHPDRAFDTNNIFLCCLVCHGKKTAGHPMPKHEQAILQYKEIN